MFVKSISSIMFRTNLASLLSGVTEQDRKLIGGSSLAEGLADTVHSYLKKAFPKHEFTSFLLKLGYGNFDNSEVKQGPTLLEYCGNLTEGIDLSSTLDHCRSMSYLDPTKSNEIVIELRGIPDYASLVDQVNTNHIFSYAKTQMFDIYHFLSQWETGNTIKYEFKMSKDLCKELDSTKPEISLAFVIRSNLNPVDGLDNQVLGEPLDGYPFATGPYGLYDTAWKDGILQFFFGSARLYPEGISATEAQYKEAVYTLNEFMRHIQSQVNSATAENGNLIGIELPGVFPRRTTPLATTFSDNFASSHTLRFETSIVGDCRPNQFYIILRHVVESILPSNGQEDLKRFCCDLSRSKCSNHIKAILLTIALKEVHLENLSFGNYLGDLINSLDGADHDGLYSYLFGSDNSNFLSSAFLSLKRNPLVRTAISLLATKKTRTERLQVNINVTELSVDGIERLLEGIQDILYPQSPALKGNEHLVNSNRPGSAILRNNK